MAESYIYTGTWINHSESVLRGGTLTLKSQHGAILVAFLATLVTSAGVSTWAVFRFALHQARSGDRPHDALSYQQQVILRNSASAPGSVFKLLQVSWAWRKHERRRIWNSWTLCLVLLAIVVWASFTVAALFSSKVTQAAGTAFLIRSPNCGLWDIDGSVENNANAWAMRELNGSRSILNYADSCYNGGNGNHAQCDTFILPSIPWATEDAPCPFDQSVCNTTINKPVRLDTGYIDSHGSLGLNAEISDRVFMRQLATCAPIGLIDYTSIVEDTLGFENVPYLRISIGSMVYNSSSYDSSWNTNYTFDWNTQTVYTRRGYDLQYATIPFPTVWALAAFDENTWQPIPEFMRTDADVTIFFLAQNTIKYTHPNSDPMFSASSRYDDGTEHSSTYQAPFDSDRYLTAVGCIDQYQFCNPAQANSNGARCGPIEPYLRLNETVKSLGFNDNQLATAEILLQSTLGMSRVATTGTVLKAENTVYQLRQEARLPANQWQIEVAGWFAYVLAALQQNVVDYSSGPKNITEQGGILRTPTSLAEKAACRRQMVRNAHGYQNFSMVGVVVIVILSSVLIFLGWTVDTLFGVMQSILQHHHARLTWIEDGYLQLQRMAYEGAGYNNVGGSAVFPPPHPPSI
ncbi:hypothetical protein BJ875DRAFT_513005 [Amylocarpus encephaloides]|uniref:Uncharacterized protein n=1 Tax=Amylocarpus encephaloides TaxID=45428 RepID=A0A9P8C9F2_9HELO|nr:hypothetical protein BJ875DRAFT_513005 [Amylocarpus encephaloides]